MKLQRERPAAAAAAAAAAIGTPPVPAGVLDAKQMEKWLEMQLGERVQQAKSLQAAYDEMQACVMESRKALDAATALRRESPERISLEQLAELQDELKSAEAEARATWNNGKLLIAQLLMARRQGNGNAENVDPSRVAARRPMLQQEAHVVPMPTAVRRPITQQEAVGPSTSRQGKKSSRRAATARRPAGRGAVGVDPLRAVEARADIVIKRERMRKAAEQRSRQVQHPSTAAIAEQSQSRPKPSAGAATSVDGVESQELAPPSEVVQRV